MTYERPRGTELAALVHRGEHIARAEEQLLGFIADLIADGAQSGKLRDDAPPGELASYCLHALTAAGSRPAAAAPPRPVTLTTTRLRRPRQPPASRRRSPECRDRIRPPAQSA